MMRKECMIQNVDVICFRGSINKDLTVNFLYSFDDNSKYKPIDHRQIPNKNGQMVDSCKIYPNILLNISQGYGAPFISVGSNTYFPFITLLEKSVKQVSEHLYEIFPDVDKIEFSGDSKMLEIYRTEKAITAAGMTCYPTIWVDSTQQCYPAIKCVTQRQPNGVIIPLADAIALNKMFSTFDPNMYGITMLRVLGKI
jgi:hypothetical protein